MIFATVGTQLPFDRMVRTLDEWAMDRGVEGVVAQIGESRYEPRGIEWSRWLPPDRYLAQIRKSRFVVSHAGMGSIISSLEASRQILIMPRRFDLSEHRSDHQMATARRFWEFPGVHVAFDEGQFYDQLDQLRDLRQDSAEPLECSQILLERVRRFVSL